MNQNERIIESERLKVKLLNGTTILVRPLTLAERKKCLALLQVTFDNQSDKLVNQYFKAQIDIIHFIIARENKNFKKEDVENLLDASLIEQVIKFTLKDPFNEIMGGL
jgi:hypothetical protein